MLNTTVIKFVDGYMVSRVGNAEMSAQFLGGMCGFIPEALFLGIMFVVNTFVSQSLGAGRIKRTGTYALAGLSIAFTAGIVLLPLLLVSGKVFSLVGHPPREQAMEAMYFNFMIASILVTLPSRVIEQFFYGIHRPRVVLCAAIVSNLSNIGLNYVLIFGNSDLGIPAMGLKGAAIGSVISWTLHFLILLLAFTSKPIREKFGTLNFRMLRMSQIWDILRIGWPTGLQFCNGLLAWSMCVMVMSGQFGLAHRTAATTAMRFMGLAFMPAIGIGSATTAMVGRYIGMGRNDLARKALHAALITAVIYMGACGMAFLVFRENMLRFFAVYLSQESGEVAEVVRVGGPIMICAAIFQVFDAVGIVYCGGLRGGGDTRWIMWVTVGMSWTVILGGGLGLLAIWPDLKSAGPWIAGSVYVIIIGLISAHRFESGAWEKLNLLKNRGEPATAAARPEASLEG